MVDDQTGRFFKERVQTVHVHVGCTAGFCILIHVFRQHEGCRIALLLADEFCDAFHFRRIDKRTLHAHGVVSLQVQHVTLTDELLCTRTVQNGT